MNDQRAEALRLAKEAGLSRNDYGQIYARVGGAILIEDIVRLIALARTSAAPQEPMKLLRDALERYVLAVAVGGGDDMKSVMAAIRSADNNARTVLAAAPQPQAPSATSDDVRDKRIAELEMVTARASFPLPGPIDDTGWVLELLQDGRITVSKAREWLRDYILHGKKGPLLEGPFKEPSVWERAEKAEARVAELEAAPIAQTADARDAARWRWIEPHFRVFSPNIDGNHHYCATGSIGRITGPTFGAAVDAAIAA